jgi:hypothetical protein
MLSDLLTRNKATILQRWVRLIVATYPADTARFLQREQDRFLNPVGHAIQQESEVILDGLLRGVPVAELGPAVDNIVKVRAVQDFVASQAVEFIFLLKTAVREVLAAEKATKPGLDEILDFEARVDGLALLAFDVYMQRRERIFEIRTKEIKGRADRLLNRLGRIYGDVGDAEPGADEPGADSPPPAR